jgi:hypothetical protein
MRADRRDRERERTDTLDCSSKDQNRHVLSYGTDQAAEFEKEDGAEKDVFGFDDSEELADE